MECEYGLKLLHITATHLNEKGGIPVVLDNLVSAQNGITGLTAKVLAVKKGVNQLANQFFYYIHELKEIEKFIIYYNPDVVVIHSVYYKEYYSISKILRKHKIKYLIEPHSAFCKAAQQKSYMKKYIANNTILRDFIKKAHGYIYLNNAEREKSVFDTINDIIVPNGIILDTKHIIAEQVAKDNSIFKLYFIGRFDLVAKGLYVLFDAIDILDKKRSNITIDFFGSGNSVEEQYIDNRISKLKNIKVHKMGALYGEEKVERLSKYHAMILTSKYEGFPMTVLEALSYGKPCIVTEGTNVVDLVSENKLGIATTDDPEDIANSILRFKEEYFKCPKSYEDRCREMIAEQYNWSNIAQQSYDALMKIL